MKILKIIILVFPFLLSSSYQKKEIKLELKYTIGDKFTIISHTEADLSIPKVSAKLKSEMQFEVCSITQNGDYLLNLNILRFQSILKNKDSYSAEIFDSAQPESEMTKSDKELHHTVHDVLNSTIKVIMNKNGIITKPLRLHNGKGVFHTDIVDIIHFEIPFPSQKISKNDTWSVTKEDVYISKYVNYTYQLKKVLENQLIIDFKTDEGSLSGFEAGKIEGTYTIDKQSCKLLKAVLKKKLSNGGKVISTYEIK